MYLPKNFNLNNLDANWGGNVATNNGTIAFHGSGVWWGGVGDGVYYGIMVQ